MVARSLLFVVLTWSSAQELHAGQDKQPTASKKQGSATPSINITVVAPEKSPEEKQEERDRAQRQETMNQGILSANERIARWTIVMGVAAGAQVLVGILVWCIYRQQARTMRQQRKTMGRQLKAAIVTSKAAKDAVLLAHPARLAVRNVVVHGFSSEAITDKIDVAYLRFVNIGAGTATLLGWNAQWFFFRGLPLENPMQVFSEHPSAEHAETVELTPGASKRIDLPKRELSLEDYAAIVNWDTFGSNRTDLYILGYARYSDEKRRLRRLFFGYQYVMKEGQFVVVNNDNYSHEE